MAPLLYRPAHGLLRCPICRRDLVAGANRLACANRHSFDVAREGYVNLLTGGGRRPAESGDSSEQLRHRASLLDAGHFDAFAATIARHVQAAAAEPNADRWQVIDAGCGTGHHLARTAAALPIQTVGLGLDLSVAAARHAARRWPEHAFAVADLWRDWPVRDAAADLVLSIFAPKNFKEMSRVLRRGGWLALIYPGPDHLIELHRQFSLMRQQHAKDERYGEAAERFIGSPNFVRYRSVKVFDAPALRDLVLMGPNARHLDPSTLAADLSPIAVTIDVAILIARLSG